MHSLDDLLAPITPEVFHADYDDRKPLHIPAAPGAPKQTLLDWERFNALLDQTSIWTAHSLKVLYNGQRVPPPRYCHDAATGSGVAHRPSPAKVKVLLAQGASLVLDEVQDLVPSIRALTPALGRAFAGQVSANLYCSFGGVQAFGTHFDLHHVFAVQCEGEKVWTLYSNRADAPTTFPIDSEETRAALAASRGPVMTQVRMRPGDVLYLPRGWYHDALATEGASLHVTFSITPADGRTVFEVLKRLTEDDATFRHFLRPAGGPVLKAQLTDLGRRLSALAASDLFVDEIAMAQERLVPREPGYALPDRPPLTLYARGQGPAPAVTGPAAAALDWALQQPRLALEDMIAQFDFVPEADLRAMVDAAIGTGALIRI
ncbi:cupin domain-containing protein [Brevundimonas sp.]|uniref:JmjC domain-containing protein n=1 Tax=Brevundimonas sp. TaxID=1871086 RepID=UPI002626896D|nr:cupin domain-containing protein [Brevundimonas sp.]